MKIKNATHEVEEMLELSNRSVLPSDVCGLI